MHTKAIGQINGKLYHNHVNVWFCHWRFSVIRRTLQLFIDDILVDKEDRKPALLRGRLFDMWHSTLGGSEEGGYVFLTCGSAVTFYWMQGGSLQSWMLWNRLVCIAFRKPEKRNIWCRMKSLQVSCSFLTVMNGNVYHPLSRFCFHWAWSLLCLSLFSLTNKIVSLFPS